MTHVVNKVIAGAALAISLLAFVMPNKNVSTSGEIKNSDDTLSSIDVLADSTCDESQIFQSIEYLTEDMVYSLIDSLLDLNVIPADLIHEIQLFVKSKYDQESDSSIEYASADNNYPADMYYHKWDTYNTHPYSENLSENDTSLELVLVDSSSKYSPPVLGAITSGFGDRRNHSGMDIDLEVWDTVAAAFDGIVRIARKHGGYGRVVVVRHYNGLESFYAHLHRIKVTSGEKVNAGQLIGLGGSSGRSTGSHLHFETRFKGKPLNPQDFIDFKNNELINDTVKLIKTQWSYSVIPNGITYHKVEKGEFLFMIAKRYGMSISHICELNGIARNSILRVGQKLKIG